MWKKGALMSGMFLLVCLVGCGKTTGTLASGGMPQTPISSATPTEQGTTPVSDANANISVIVDLATLQSTGKMIVTITNHSAMSISVSDHQSNCSVVQLQQQLNDAWTTLAPCKLMTATRLVAIAAGTSVIQDLGIGPRTATSHWAPGQYRVKVIYVTTNDGAQHGASLESVSAEFSVA